MKRKTERHLAWAAILLILFVVGCSDSSKKPRKIRNIDGTARKIDLKNNVVSMIVVDKEGHDREMQGTVRDDAEVIINGRASKLEDVREGDKVTVSYYKEGKDDDVKFIATKIEVKRAKDEDWTSTRGGTAASTQPAPTPPGKP
jgi:hypothetical protein